MAKIIKISILEDEKNPLTEAEKTDVSMSTLEKIKKYFRNGKQLSDKGYYTFDIKDKLVKVEWHIEEDGILTPDMIKKANFFVKNDEVIEDEQLKKEYLDEANVLEYSRTMPKPRSTGFFMLAAYIYGYDIEYIKEVKKMKLGEFVDPNIIEKIYKEAHLLVKEMQKDKVTDAIDNLLGAMYTKDFQETEGIHIEDKNSPSENVKEWNFEDYSHGGNVIAKCIEVDCKVWNDKLTKKQRYEFSTIVQKECDLAINKGIKEGQISYTFPDGLKIEANWKINDNKEDIEALEELHKASTEVKNNLMGVLRSTSPEVKLGLILKAGVKLGYDMPYAKECESLMMGIQPSDEMKPKICNLAVNILQQIFKDHKGVETAKIISDMLLSINN